MQTLAIIAEYNPFHNGHAYMLAKARELTNADYSIAIIGGNFLQRGQAAMWDKFQRASMAVASGIDLCLELPFAYATGSARDFADGAVRILDRLCTVDYLCFGAETDDLKLLEKIATIAVNEPDIYIQNLRELMQTGISYPAARASALIKFISDTEHIDCSELNAILSSPNNILAIEYLCALKRCNSNIKPVIIKRTGADYHDRDIDKAYCSASAIRTALQNDNADLLTHAVPDSVIPYIHEASDCFAPIYENDITPFLQCSLLNFNSGCAICDINSDLEDKIRKLPANISFESAISELKSKNITASRVSRALIHLILQYLENDRNLFIENGYAFYANVLAFRKSNSALLKKIKQYGKIPLITKKADFFRYLEEYKSINSNAAKRQWELDIKASMLYNCLVYNRYKNNLPNDFSRILPIF